MKRIEELDKNFAVAATVDAPLVFTSCTQPPFAVCGLLQDEGGFTRLPRQVAEAVSPTVAVLCRNTAGGRLRFCTDSPRIAIRAAMTGIGRMPHFPLTGSAGFDLYADGAYCGTFVPPLEMTDGYESMLTLPDARMREILIHFPLYSNVTALDVGLCPGAALQAAPAYRDVLPVVYYGSSITQGGCASRPGNCYQNILSRRLNCDHRNLGFSGAALAEEAMADYIAGLPMAAFVYDYDHNAPDAAYLRRTHRRLFLTVRARHPQLPILLVSRPQPRPTADDDLRRSVILDTYQQALADGDKHIYFVDGSTLLRPFGGDGGTVDNCHPNDLGFWGMAVGIGAVLEQCL